MSTSDEMLRRAIFNETPPYAPPDALAALRDYRPGKHIRQTPTGYRINNSIPQGHPYFCLECKVVEIYDEVPQENGRAMLPWHEHGGARVLLRPMNHGECASLVGHGTPLVRHPATKKSLVEDLVAYFPMEDNRPASLPDPAGDRLRAVLAKVREEGW